MSLDAKYAKICLVASAGGHLRQISKLESAYGRYDHFIISTAGEVTPAELTHFPRAYLLPGLDEGRWRNPLRFALVSLGILMIFLRERPRFLISTGAGMAVPCFLWARLLRIRSIYVEEGVRISSLSRTGRACYRLANLFIVQHRFLANRLSRAVYGQALSRHLFG